MSIDLTKRWLLTCMDDGRKVTLNSFDFEFEAWAARALVNATLGMRIDSVRVEGNKSLLGAPLVKQPAQPPRPTADEIAGALSAVLDFLDSDSVIDQQTDAHLRMQRESAINKARSLVERVLAS